MYVKSLQLTTRPEKSKQFIDDYLRATNKVVTSYRPEQSTATIFLQAEVYLKFTEVIFDLIFKLMAEPLDMKLFSQFASFCADYIACPTMQLDKLGTNQRNKLLKRHGDCRLSMTVLLSNAFTKLGKSLKIKFRTFFHVNHLYRCFCILIG